MKRRAFAQALLAAPLAAHAALTPDADWTLAYQGLQADLPPLRLAARGRLPAGLAGAFYRNGTGRHELGGVRYHHPFDGDGFVQRYAVGPGGVVHHGRFVRTPKFVADSAAGRPVREAFDTRPANAEPTLSPDAINAANTSVMMAGSTLLALWEGGSATQLDPATLDTRGPRAWAPQLAGLPFSAHPRTDVDGTVWNFGIDARQAVMVIYRLRADGTLDRHALLKLPYAAMVHDFAITERHLVFLLPPLVFDRARVEAGETFLGSHAWRPELGLRALVLPKDRLDAPQWFELPAGFVFHIGNAWDDRGTLRLDCMRTSDAWHATEGLRQTMQGRHRAHEYASLALVSLDTRSGRAEQQLTGTVAEFPRIDPRLAARRCRHVYAAARVDCEGRPGYDAVQRLDLEGGAVDRFHYGRDVMAEEHLFVPGAAGSGWVVGTALDLRRRRMLFSVFDPDHLADGPLYQAEMDRVVPPGLHGIFVPAGG